MKPSPIQLPSILSKEHKADQNIAHAIGYYAKLLQKWQSEPPTQPPQPQCFIISDASVMTHQSPVFGGIVSIVIFANRAIILRTKIMGTIDNNALEYDAAMQGLAVASKADPNITHVEFQLDNTAAVKKLQENPQNAHHTVRHVRSQQSSWFVAIDPADRNNYNNFVKLHNLMHNLVQIGENDPEESLSLEIAIPPLDIGPSGPSHRAHK